MTTEAVHAINMMSIMFTIPTKEKTLTVQGTGLTVKLALVNAFQKIKDEVEPSELSGGVTYSILEVISAKENA